jgi:anti-anti-sigma regulatory factor
MKNAHIIFSPGKNDNSIEVLINGDLTIANVPDFKERIVGQVSNKEIIEVIVDDVNAVDLAFYQFLVSMKKTFEASSKQLKVLYSLPEDIEKLFINSGLDLNSN